MLYLKLVVDEHTIDTSDEDPEPRGRYTYRRTHTDWQPRRIEVSEKDGNTALGVDFDVKPGDIVHCVYAIYSSGGTFLSAENSDFEVISFHKSTEVAVRNHNALMARKEEDYKMTIEFDSGAKVERHCPWDGYFESLSCVEIFTGIVQHATIE